MFFFSPCSISIAGGLYLPTSGISADQSPFRHRRTHEPRQDGEPLSNFSEEELENDDDQLGPLEEESPGSEHNFLSGGFGMGSGMTDLAAPLATMAAPSQLIAAHNY